MLDRAAAEAVQAERVRGDDEVARGGRTDDVAELSSAVTETVPTLSTSVLTVVATVIALFALDWQFVVIPLVPALALAGTAISVIATIIIGWFLRVRPASAIIVDDEQS